MTEKTIWQRALVNTMTHYAQHGHHRIGADLLSEDCDMERDDAVAIAKTCPELVVEEDYDRTIIILKTAEPQYFWLTEKA